MADTLTAPASGRCILRLPAQPSTRPPVPVAEYARAFALRMARLRAGRAAQRRADLRAKAFELIAADRLNGRA
jgi:hypothetical protein